MNNNNVCPGCGAYMKEYDKNCLVCEYCGTKIIYQQTSETTEKLNTKSKNKLQKSRLHKNLSLFNASRSLVFLLEIYLFAFALIMLAYLITTCIHINNNIAVTILFGLFIFILLIVLLFNLPVIILFLIANRRIKSKEINVLSKRFSTATRILSIIYMISSLASVILMIVIIAIS